MRRTIVKKKTVSQEKMKNFDSAMVLVVYHGAEDLWL